MDATCRSHVNHADGNYTGKVIEMLELPPRALATPWAAQATGRDFTMARKREPSHISVFGEDHCAHVTAYYLAARLDQIKRYDRKAALSPESAARLAQIERHAAIAQRMREQLEQAERAYQVPASTIPASTAPLQGMKDALARYAPSPSRSLLADILARLPPTPPAPPPPPAEPAPAPEPEWRSGEDWLESVGFSRFPRRPPSRPGAKPESLRAWCKRLSDEMPDRIKMKPGSIETYVHRHSNKAALVKTLGER
jgi:hypothetical protein